MDSEAAVSMMSPLLLGAMSDSAHRSRIRPIDSVFGIITLSWIICLFATLTGRCFTAKRKLAGRELLHAIGVDVADERVATAIDSDAGRARGSRIALFPPDRAGDTYIARYGPGWPGCPFRPAGAGPIIAPT